MKLLLLKEEIKQSLRIPRELSEIFNEHHVNIVKNSTGKKSTHVARDNNIFDTDQGIELIRQSFMNHSSISRIKQNSPIQCFPCGNEICLMTPNEILKLFKKIDTKTVGCRL